MGYSVLGTAQIGACNATTQACRSKIWTLRTTVPLKKRRHRAGAEITTLESTETA